MSAGTEKAADKAIIPDINIDAVTSGDLLKDISSYEGMFTEMAITWGVRLLVAIVILIVGWAVGNWVNRRFEKLHRFDNTLKNFLGGLFKYTIIAVSIITVIGLFGIPMASLLAVMGAAGLAIGLALQGTLSNVASGVMLLILRPFNVGDYIEFGTQGGTVKSLSLFGTELAKADNVYLFAPNSKIWGSEIVNYSRNTLRRQDIVVSVSYDDDLNKAISILESIAAADERVLKEPEDKEPQILTDKLSDYSIDVIVRVWSQNSDYWALRWDLTKQIKEKLEAAGISMALTTRQLAVEDKPAVTSQTERK